MDGDTRYSIGDLARLTGLSVKAIRYYSDRGIVPPTDRSPAGYRQYGPDAVARLGLVRTLRDLGLDLPTIQRILDRDIALPEVAAVHARALEVQIRTLRRRHAVLAIVARRGATPEEIALMHKLAKLSEAERRHLVEDFLGTVFGGLDADPAFVGIARSMNPELPDNPTIAQVEAWVELAGLTQDADFRAGLRRVVEEHAAERLGDNGVLARDTAALVRDLVRPALAAGADPASSGADLIVETVIARQHGPDGLELRQALLARLAAVADPRRERYLQLLSVINGWSAPESLAPTLDWFIEALRARMPTGG
jgi:DNA-binding transcriptional MerR regulator